MKHIVKRDRKRKPDSPLTGRGLSISDVSWEIVSAGEPVQVLERPQKSWIGAAISPELISFVCTSSKRVCVCVCSSPRSKSRSRCLFWA
jgi:hypothetical protein